MNNIPDFTLLESLSIIYLLFVLVYGCLVYFTIIYKALRVAEVKHHLIIPFWAMILNFIFFMLAFSVVGLVVALFHLFQPEDFKDYIFRMIDAEARGRK